MEGGVPTRRILERYYFFWRSAPTHGGPHPPKEGSAEDDAKSKKETKLLASAKTGREDEKPKY